MALVVLKLRLRIVLSHRPAIFSEVLLQLLDAVHGNIYYIYIQISQHRTFFGAHQLPRHEHLGSEMPLSVEAV